jgi:hypothetical protein
MIAAGKMRAPEAEWTVVVPASEVEVAFNEKVSGWSLRSLEVWLHAGAMAR